MTATCEVTNGHLFGSNYKLPKLQHDWLVSNGIPARRRRDGKVVVTWEQINAATTAPLVQRARPNPVSAETRRDA